MVNGTGDRGGKETATKRGDKVDRLAEALRANLRRRKAQTRARRGGAAIAQEDAGTGPDKTTQPDDD
jgi:hypothetical protein